MWLSCCVNRRFSDWGLVCVSVLSFPPTAVTRSTSRRWAWMACLPLWSCPRAPRNPERPQLLAGHGTLTPPGGSEENCIWVCKPGTVLCLDAASSPPRLRDKQLYGDWGWNQTHEGWRRRSLQETGGGADIRALLRPRTPQEATRSRKFFFFFCWGLQRNVWHFSSKANWKHKMFLCLTGQSMSAGGTSPVCLWNWKTFF